MINPPELPQDTHPTRMLFVLGGFIFALIAGTASVVVAQLASHSVVGARHLEALAGVAPLVIVPHILTAKQQNSRLPRRIVSQSRTAFHHLIPIL